MLAKEPAVDDLETVEPLRVGMRRAEMKVGRKEEPAEEMLEFMELKRLMRVIVMVRRINVMCFNFGD